MPANKYGSGFATVDIKPVPLPNHLPYDMPDVHVGQLVNWFAGCSPSSHPEPCIVKRVAHRTVLLTAVDKNAIVPHYAIHHAGDPAVQNPNIRLNGCWDRTTWDKEIYDRLDRTERAVAQIRAELGIVDPDAPAVVVESDEERERKAAELAKALEQDADLLEVE